MALLKGGHEEPLTILMSRHGSDLIRYFQIRSCDAQAAQELANETFYRAYSRALTFDSTKSFKPWFYAVATNVWRGWLRRRQAPELPLHQLPEQTEAQAPAPSSAGREKAVGLLAQLSETDREILILRHYEGLKLKDIAERLGLTPGAVYTRIFRALDKLRLSNPSMDSM